SQLPGRRREPAALLRVAWPTGPQTVRPLVRYTRAPVVVTDWQAPVYSFLVYSLPAYSSLVHSLPVYSLPLFRQRSMARHCRGSRRNNQWRRLSADRELLPTRRAARPVAVAPRPSARRRR